MLFVLLSCAGVPGCGFFAWLMGYMGGQDGDLSHSFYLVPLCYLVLVVLIAIDRWHYVRERRDGTDATSV